MEKGTCVPANDVLAKNQCFQLLVVHKCKSMQNQPLFPEGDPFGGPVSAILKFQKYTMEAMYGAVDKALKEAGSDKHPQDYLQFMCLGKRVAGPMEGPNEGGKGKAGIMSHRHRRFMVCNGRTRSAGRFLAFPSSCNVVLHGLLAVCIGLQRAQ